MQYFEASNRLTTIRLRYEISYSAVRSQLLLLTPLSSVGKVFSLLLQEESKRSLTSVVRISIDSQAMVAEQSINKFSRLGPTYANQFAKQKGKYEAICSYCGYSGHLIDKCFQIIGYSPGWKKPKENNLLPGHILAKIFKGYLL